MGLRVSVTPMALAAFVALAIVLALVGWAFIGLSFAEAAAGGLVASLIHYVLSFLHHVGHSIAARRTGYPMIGVHFWGLLGRSEYPRDEGSLPAAVHIRRALGGPIVSAVISLILAVLVAAVRPPDNLLDWLLVFALVDNFLTYTLGVWIPLKSSLGLETDMDTLMRWRK